jgi:hypothetical protein
MNMICWSVKRRTHAYVDRTMGSVERACIERHLRTCESCSCQCEQIASLRLALNRLPPRQAPAGLAARLRIAASRERRVVIENNGSRWSAAWSRWKFRLDQFMRPLTIPATGGLLSSVVLFGALAFTISSSSTPPVSYDVPVLIGQIDTTLVPVELRSSVVLTISLDSDGHIADYAVRDGSQSFVGDSARSEYESISVPSFSSIFAAAHPVTRDIRISFTPIMFKP